MSAYPCPCCEGAGCEECSGTGLRVTTYLEVDGCQMRVSGNQPLDAEAVAALTELGRAAMNLIGGPDSPGPKGPRRKTPQEKAERALEARGDAARRRKGKPIAFPTQPPFPGPPDEPTDPPSRGQSV